MRIVRYDGIYDLLNIFQIVLVRKSISLIIIGYVAVIKIWRVSSVRWMTSLMKILFYENAAYYQCCLTYCSCTDRSAWRSLFKVALLYCGVLFRCNASYVHLLLFSDGDAHLSSSFMYCWRVDRSIKLSLFSYSSLQYGVSAYLKSALPWLECSWNDSDSFLGSMFDYEQHVHKLDECSLVKYHSRQHCNYQNEAVNSEECKPCYFFCFALDGW